MHPGSLFLGFSLFEFSYLSNIHYSTIQVDGPPWIQVWDTLEDILCWRTWKPETYYVDRRKKPETKKYRNTMVSEYLKGEWIFDRWASHAPMDTASFSRIVDKMRAQRWSWVWQQNKPSCFSDEGESVAVCSSKIWGPDWWSSRKPGGLMYCNHGNGDTELLK
jgi:hypothetical protein